MGAGSDDSSGRPRVAEEIEQLVVRMAEENPTLGLSPHPGCPGEPGASHRQDHGAQYPAPPSPGTCSATPQGGYELGAVPEAALGGPRRHRLLHGGGRDVAWPGDLLCARRHGAGHAARPDRGHHPASYRGLHAAMRPAVDGSLRRVPPGQALSASTTGTRSSRRRSMHCSRPAGWNRSSYRRGVPI